ncbi:unnamed protein product, partial [Allacma fusca]
SNSNYRFRFFWWKRRLTTRILNTNTRSSAPHWKLVVEENGKNIITPNPTLTLPAKGTGNVIFPENGGVPFDDEEGGNSSFVTRSSRRKSSGKNSNHSRKSQTQYWISAEEDDELVLKILATTVISPKGLWTKNGHELYCASCPMAGSNAGMAVSGSGQVSSSEEYLMEGQEVLDCGRPANFTYYDQLIGVANRQSHPHIPEPQVAMVFRKKGSKKDTIDLNTLERKLRKAKKEKPSSVQLYNQIGNFWRIKGHTLRAIECFRRALAVAPNNPEVSFPLKVTIGVVG